MSILHSGGRSVLEGLSYGPAFGEPSLDALVRRTEPACGHTPRFGGRGGLPVLEGAGQVVRDLVHEDARSLFESLATPEVARFTVDPPGSPQGFERFIDWTHEQRASGLYACFAIVPREIGQAVGLIQIRQRVSNEGTAEWGFAIGSRFWGTGLFIEGATLVVDFAFREMGVHRLEARSLVNNGRANGALRKLGAEREGVLRRAFERRGEYHDESMWALIREEPADPKVRLASSWADISRLPS